MAAETAEQFVLGDPEAKEKRADYHGGCQYSRVSPEMGASHMIDIPFEEALKLSVAIQSAILDLNRIDRRSERDMGLRMSIRENGRSITVFHGRIHLPGK